MAFETCRTNQNKLLIIKDNYKYREVREDMDGNKTFRCTVKSCSSRLHTNPSSLAQDVSPDLLILPSSSVQTKPIGKPVLLTCRPTVQRELITELRWLDPRGEPVRNDRAVYTEQLPGDASLALIIRALREADAGNYTCTATFANSEKLSRSVRIETIVAITWEDAPEEQHPILHSDYKVKCKVTANPAPMVDWLKNSEMIGTDDRLVVETDGLLIRKVTEADDGVYVCRAIVLETGELAERHINVEVHTPPTFENMQTEAEVVEGDSGSITCVAKGKPAPHYYWVKADTRQDLSSTERFSSNLQTGVLTINPAHRNDRGQYKCRARNAAGDVERSVTLSVVVRPHIDELINISVPLDREATMKCVATGYPLPQITFQRIGSQNRLVPGAQPNDDRVVLQQDRLPPLKPNGEERAQGQLIISGLLRSDDGLYACIATNKGGEALKNGHVTVEFPPSFASTPLKEAWSWDRNPVNITCLAESIPNATISWRLNDREIERDPNIQQIGTGPESVLRVTPIDRIYYGVYKCRANNIHGVAEHEITLREAHPPSQVLQAKLEVITATTITFLFIGPGDDGGLPIRAYAVQYKEERRNWNEAFNKTWPVDSPYILEGLEPQVSYNFRFAARNDVGFGNWAADQHYTMPKRSAPEEPRILNTIVSNGVAVSPYNDHFELRWRIPADNGEPIDQYNIKYCVAKNSSEGWKEVGTCVEHDRTALGAPSYHMTGLRSDTYYKVELRAHNAIGYSLPGQITIRTARDPTKNGGATAVTEARGPALSSAAIIGIIVAALILVFILVDISCCIFNSAGLTYLLFSRCKSGQLEDSKIGSGEKEPLKGPTVGLGSGKESVVMINDDRLKKDTEVEYDPKRDGARILMAKHSAV